jgi:hypothetical protein
VYWLIALKPFAAAEHRKGLPYNNDAGFIAVDQALADT